MIKVRISIEGKQGEGKSTLAGYINEFFETHYFNGLEGCNIIIVEEGSPENNKDLSIIEEHDIIIRVKTI